MSDNPVNKLPDWIKRSGWIRENGELPGAKEPIDPNDIKPVNDTPFDESLQSPDQEIVKPDENQSSPDDTETLQQAVDSLNPEDLPSEITVVSLDNEIGSVSVDLTEHPNEISSVEATITSGEAIVQFPETGKNDVELVQSDNFLTDLPSIPEDLANSDKFEDLPEMVEEYKKIKKTGVLLAPAGHIPERVKFINNVINNIKIKTNGKECNRKATATIARSNKKPSN